MKRYLLLFLTILSIFAAGSDEFAQKKKEPADRNIAADSSCFR